jgi:hypothetical protein
MLSSPDRAVNRSLRRGAYRFHVYETHRTRRPEHVPAT